MQGGGGQSSLLTPIFQVYTIPKRDTLPSIEELEAKYPTILDKIKGLESETD